MSVQGPETVQVSCSDGRKVKVPIVQKRYKKRPGNGHPFQRLIEDAASTNEETE
jgi:hypothetical protein